MLLGSPPPGRFVPGEVLVKFAPGTEASAAVMRAGRLSPPDLEALAPPVTTLQAKTGLPLRAKQVTGGQWVLLAVDGEKLVERLAEQLRGRANVADVRLSPDSSEGDGEAPGSRGIVVRFSAGSAEAHTVAQKRSGGVGDRFAQLVRALGKDVALPLKGEATADATLLLHVELRTLTLMLSEQLKALADVESAEPNYIMTIR
jgi:hypothetical protein